MRAPGIGVSLRPYNFFFVDAPHPKTASNGHAHFSQPYLLHFMYLCPADFEINADGVLASNSLPLASVRRALPYAERHKAVGLG